MTAQRFVDQLNVQIGNEFAAHQQYVACGVYYQAHTMPQTASFFHRQALEERDHAMMMIQFLLDTGAEVSIPGVEAPVNNFDSVLAPIELAMAQEKRVSEEIYTLTRIAREENDFAAEQFMTWFIKEQVEEVASMSALLVVVRRSKGDVEAIEEYIAREGGSRGGDPAAPRKAGV